MPYNIIIAIISSRLKKIHFDVRGWYKQTMNKIKGNIIENALWLFKLTTSHNTRMKAKVEAKYGVIYLWDRGKNN